MLEQDDHEDELLSYILRAFEEGSPLTLLDLYRNNAKYSWTVFVSTVGHLVSKGYLEGKGDGFAVRYLLTEKGRNLVSPTG